MAELTSAKDLEKRLMLRLRTLMKTVVVAVDDELQKVTPVKTGRLRANWIVGINRPRTKPIYRISNRVPPDGYKRPARENPETRIFPEKQRYLDLYLSNATPYAMKRNIEGGKKVAGRWVERAVLSVTRRGNI